MQPYHLSRVDRKAFVFNELGSCGDKWNLPFQATSYPACFVVECESTLIKFGLTTYSLSGSTPIPTSVLGSRAPGVVITP